MTTNPRNAPKAGRELDALVIHEVLGIEVLSTDPEEAGTQTRIKQALRQQADPCWSVDDEGRGWLTTGALHTQFEPSEQIEAAWVLVEALRQRYRVEVHALKEGFVCQIEKGDELAAEYIAVVEAGTAPLAICQAITETITPSSLPRTPGQTHPQA